MVSGGALTWHSVGAGVTFIAWDISVLVFCHGTMKMVCLGPATSFTACTTKPQIGGDFSYFLASMEMRDVIIRTPCTVFLLLCFDCPVLYLQPFNSI